MKLPDHLYVFVETYFLFLPPPPPPVHNLVPWPHICIRSSCACHVKRFEKIPHYRMHVVTVSSAVTSFEFLVSEIFNGNTPPKTYTCQNEHVGKPIHSKVPPTGQTHHRTASKRRQPTV
jgi:hypothetical protein